MADVPADTLSPSGDVAPQQAVPQGGYLPRRRAVGMLTLARRNKLATAGLLTTVGLTLFCFAGPLLYHTNETATNLLLANLPPSAAHPLGTSPEGRDEIGQLMVGGQSTLEVGFAVAILGTLFGMVWLAT
jgi:peptide/nickel transport system permease protein